MMRSMLNLEISVSEDLHQMALISWADNYLTRKKYPELKWLFHAANGGKRHIATAVKLKKMGVRAGVFDLCLPISRNGYHALWIELKYGKNKPTKEQLEFMAWQEVEGAKCVVCWDWQDAKVEIENYLKT